MVKKKEYANHFNRIKSFYKIADGFSLKYIPMYIIISATSNIILQYVLHKDIVSRLTFFIIMLISIPISLLWTKFVLETNISIFDRPLTKYLKKQALSRRGVAIIFFYLIVDAVGSIETSGDIITMIWKWFALVSFSICIIVLIVSFIIIAFRRIKRPVRR
ncbi:MAG: hypothetical protein GX323_08560 [Clostridiales bacterium]|nr:hypothetical protein [Clostridiales bacterium]